jgi:hypothetical protein
MARTVMISLFLIGIFGLTYLGYRHWSENRAMAMGDVFQDSNQQSAAPVPVPAQPTQPAQPIVYPPAKTNIAATSAAGQRAPAAGQTPLPPQGQRVVPGAPPKAAAGIATDTISPNPPNGMAFAGSGRFQVYRQGSLTWRIDTDTGQTCILFATNAEWRKPQVYRHGCRSGATP